MSEAPEPLATARRVSNVNHPARPTNAKRLTLLEYQHELPEIKASAQYIFHHKPPVPHISILLHSDLLNLAGTLKLLLQMPIFLFYGERK